MSSFLFTSCYNVMFSLTSTLCLDNRITRSESSTKINFRECYKIKYFEVPNFQTNLPNEFAKKSRKFVTLKYMDLSCKHPLHDCI